MKVVHQQDEDEDMFTSKAVKHLCRFSLFDVVRGDFIVNSATRQEGSVFVAGASVMILK